MINISVLHTIVVCIYYFPLVIISRSATTSAARYKIHEPQQLYIALNLQSTVTYFCELFRLFVASKDELAYYKHKHQKHCNHGPL